MEGEIISNHGRLFVIALFWNATIILALWFECDGISFCVVFHLHWLFHADCSSVRTSYINLVHMKFGFFDTFDSKFKRLLWNVNLPYSSNLKMKSLNLCCVKLLFIILVEIQSTATKCRNSSFYKRLVSRFDSNCNA